MNYFKENITFWDMYISQCLKFFLRNLKCNTKCIMTYVHFSVSLEEDKNLYIFLFLQF